jgi:hypothetical protein
MRITFPDALVNGWEQLVPTIHLPDPNDRHVVAAARAGHADVIVTDNLADFPPAALPASIIRQSLDDFLLDIFDLHPGQVVTAVHAIAGRTGRFGPTMTAAEIASYLSTHGTPHFGERLLAALTATLSAPDCPNRTSSHRSHREAAGHARYQPARTHATAVRSAAAAGKRRQAR